MLPPRWWPQAAPIRSPTPCPWPSNPLTPAPPAPSWTRWWSSRIEHNRSFSVQNPYHGQSRIKQLPVMPKLPKIAEIGIYRDDFQFWHSLATGVPGKPDFGLLGWNFGDSGNSLIRGKVLPCGCRIYNTCKCRQEPPASFPEPSRPGHPAISDSHHVYFLRQG